MEYTDVRLNTKLRGSMTKRRRIVLSVSVELDARFRNVMYKKRLLIAYQNSSGLFTRSPFLNLNMFEKAHIGHKW